MKKINFSKIFHLPDWMSSEYSPLNSHLVSSGDDIYHDHSFYEIIYILSGKIKHFVNEQEYDLEAGDLIYVRPNDRHIFIREDNNTTVHRDLVISISFFESICSFLSESFLKDYHSSYLPFKINVSLEFIDKLETEVAKYYRIPSINPSQKIVYAKFLLIKLLSYFDQPLENFINNSYPSWLNQLEQIMNMSQYYKEGLPSILKMFNFDKSYMCHVFKNYFGETMTDYLNNLRLIYAANKIRLTNNSILYICEETGFSSVSYFTKIFKAKFHCTPLKYRKKMKIEKNNN